MTRRGDQLVFGGDLARGGAVDARNAGTSGVRPGTSRRSPARTGPPMGRNDRPRFQRWCAVAAVEGAQHVVGREEVDGVEVHRRGAEDRAAGPPAPLHLAVRGGDRVEKAVLGAHVQPVVERGEGRARTRQRGLPQPGAAIERQGGDPAIVQQHVEPVAGHRGARPQRGPEVLFPDRPSFGRAQHHGLAVGGADEEPPVVPGRGGAEGAARATRHRSAPPAVSNATRASPQRDEDQSAADGDGGVVQRPEPSRRCGPSRDRSRGDSRNAGAGYSRSASRAGRRRGRVGQGSAVQAGNSASAGACCAPGAGCADAAPSPTSTAAAHQDAARSTGTQGAAAKSRRI